MLARSATHRTLLFAVMIGAMPAAHGQETPLYEQAPSDLVVLDTASDSATLAVLPLTAEQRTGNGPLLARLVSNPSVEVEISRSSIARVLSFQEQLLEAAKKHSAAKEYGFAYDHFARLDRDFPGTPGFRKAFAAALMSEAASRARSGDYDHSLALLETLTEREPGAPGLARAVDRVGDVVLRTRWESGDFLGVRAAIDTLESQFKALPLTVGEQWRGRLEGGSDEQREKARELAAAGLTRAALRALTGAKALAPDSLETNELLQELSSGGRTLWVGVWQAAGESTPPDLDAPAALRQSRLTGGRLGALEDYPQPGAEFAPTVRGIDFDDDRRTITVGFEGDANAGARFARAMLRAAAFDDPLGLLRHRTASVAVEPDNRVRVNLRGPHPNPLALASLPLPETVADIAPGTWRRVEPLDGSGAAARYERTSGGGAFDAIEEYVYDKAAVAIDALRSRELHVLANLPAANLTTIQSVPGLAVAGSRVPTLHCLLIGPDSPLRYRRELRRALCYAIAREETLKTLITGGEDLPGFETLSTAMPRGLSLGDPMRYAYVDSIEPRPYDPRLAALLLTAARATDLDPDTPVDPSDDVPNVITLAYPDTPTVRLVVDALRSQLGAVGIGIDLRPASEADLEAGLVEHDLRYAELRVNEPLVDCWRVFGPGGIAGGCSPAMRSGLDRVVDTPSGADAAAALRDLHRIAFADVPIIPLWQTVDHIAHLKSLRGMPEETVDLYQTVSRWRVSQGGGR